MQYTGALFHFAPAGKKTMPAPALLPGFVVANRDTSDIAGGVHEPSVYACQLSRPDLSMRRLIHGIQPLLDTGLLGKLDVS